MGKKIVSKTAYAKMCGVSAAAVTKFIKGRGSDAVVGSRIDAGHPAAVEYLKEKTAPRPESPAPGVDALFEATIEACQTSGRWTATNIQRTMRVGYNRACRILDQLRAAGHVPADQIEKTPKGPSGTSKAPPPPNPAPEKPRQHGKGRKSSWRDDSELVEVPDDIEALADLTLRELIEKFGTGYRFLDWLKALKEIEAVNEKRIKNAQATGKLISRKLVEVGVVDPFNAAHVRLMTDGAKAITAAVLAKHQAGISEPEIEAYVADVVGSFIRPVKAKIERNLAHVTVDL